MSDIVVDPVLPEGLKDCGCGPNCSCGSDCSCCAQGDCAAHQPDDCPH